MVWIQTICAQNKPLRLFISFRILFMCSDRDIPLLITIIAIENYFEKSIAHYYFVVQALITGNENYEKLLHFIDAQNTIDFIFTNVSP